MDTETDKSCNDSKKLHDYMRHFDQKSQGHTTHAKTATIYFTINKNRASLFSSTQNLAEHSYSCSFVAL